MERGAQPGNGNAKKGAEWRQAIKRPLNQPEITILKGRFRPKAVVYLVAQPRLDSLDIVNVLTNRNTLHFLVNNSDNI